MNYYELLEVSPAASIDVIKNAYKTLAKKYHPDAYKGDKIFAEEKMKVLNEAISVLEDEEKRREYDTLNGIYQNAEIYDDDSGLSINVDENGEPAFFSYSSGFEEDGVTSKKNSFMDTIDDFLSKKKVKNKSRRRKKSVGLDDSGESSGGDVIEDILNDINELDLFKDISEFSETGGNTDTEAADGADELDEIELSLKKGKAPRWYYITVTGLITGSIIILFLIFSSLNISNVMDIINRLSGSSGETGLTEHNPTSAAVPGAEPEYTTAENTIGREITTDVPLIPLETEDLTTVDITEPLTPPNSLPLPPVETTLSLPLITEPAEEETFENQTYETDTIDPIDYTEEPASLEESPFLPDETEFETEEPDFEETETETDAEEPEEPEILEDLEDYTETEGH